MSACICGIVKSPYRDYSVQGLFWNCVYDCLHLIRIVINKRAGTRMSADHQATSGFLYILQAHARLDIDAQALQSIKLHNGQCIFLRVPLDSTPIFSQANSPSYLSLHLYLSCFICIIKCHLVAPLLLSEYIFLFICFVVLMPKPFRPRAANKGKTSNTPTR